jgi:hypothetical protein
MPIKSFRGMLADGGQDKISLKTNNGLTGYRIVKFRVTPQLPAQFQTSTMMIWKVEQSSVPTATATVDFSDQTLLAVGNYVFNSGEGAINDQVIFDNETFNQDIYITHTEEIAALNCNYYIELEQVRLDLNEQTVATLKNIRNVKSDAI